ncbi:MAG: glycosyltransferase family 2 protein [Candidatus Aenigmarchaeota archaeon]|nr:glycosyltransferase family 2 protein [Candidatus Aenigmarchaeota archaeon]
MKIIIFMPAYNAAKTIESVFPRIPKSVYRKLHKIIIVNDGSRDDTAKVVKKLSRLYKKIKLITHKVNRGYAQTQKTGYKAALAMGADVVVMLHSDGQYSPEYLDKLLEPLENNKADVVQGSRILGGEALKGGMPSYKFVGNRISSFIENIVSGLDISEYHSGYMLYNKKALTKIPFEKLADIYHSHKGTCHYDGEMILISNRMGLRIKEVPIPTIYAGEISHVNPYTYGFEVLQVIIRYVTKRYKF